MLVALHSSCNTNRGLWFTVMLTTRAHRHTSPPPLPVSFSPRAECITLTSIPPSFSHHSRVKFGPSPLHESNFFIRLRKRNPVPSCRSSVPLGSSVPHLALNSAARYNCQLYTSIILFLCPCNVWLSMLLSVVQPFQWFCMPEHWFSRCNVQQQTNNVFCFYFYGFYSLL